jgi:heat shock protein HslJ
MGKFVLMAVLAGITGCATTSSIPGKSYLVGGWVVNDIGESPVVDDSPATIEFTQEDQVGGNASCNLFAT